MKHLFFTLTTPIFLTSVFLASCKSPAEKVENAQQKVTEANQDLEKANEEYIKDMESYRIETMEEIDANERRIAELKGRITNQKKEIKDEYNKKIDDLERRNDNMKKEISNYKAEGKEKWEIFKKEFNHDMDELGKAFKDLSVDNVK